RRLPGRLDLDRQSRLGDLLHERRGVGPQLLDRIRLHVRFRRHDGYLRKATAHGSGTSVKRNGMVTVAARGPVSTRRVGSPWPASARTVAVIETVPFSSTPVSTAPTRGSLLPCASNTSGWPATSGTWRNVSCSW